MRIFITGASGFIGEEVALALRRAGHTVYGLVRDEKKGKVLAENEVRLVIGDLADKKSYIDVAKTCSVLIHTAADYAKFAELDTAAVNALSEAAAATHDTNKQNDRIVIYTSGVLVYGHDANRFQDETAPTVRGHPFMGSRIKNEDATLALQHAAGVVIRPAFVYGKRSQHYFEHFAGALAGRVAVKLPQHSHALVHIDDLVDAYVRIVQAPPAAIRGQIFNVTDHSRISNLQIAQRFSAVAGFTGKIETDDKAWEVANKTVLVDSRKLTRVLGWQPRHLPLLDEVEELFLSWKARNPQVVAAHAGTRS